MYNEAMGRMMTDDEIAERDRLLAQQAAETEKTPQEAEQKEENADSENTQTEDTDKQ